MLSAQARGVCSPLLVSETRVRYFPNLNLLVCHHNPQQYRISKSNNFVFSLVSARCRPLTG